MCGIFGLLTNKETKYSQGDLRNILLKAAEYSEVRGKDSSGITFRNTAQQKIEVLKGPLSVTSLLKTDEFKNRLKSSFTNLAFGHARLATNGTHLKDINNQPVIKDGIIGVHNGIIVNVAELWQKHSDLKRDYDIDTEVMLALIRKYIKGSNSTIESVGKCLEEIFGTVASAFLFNDRPEFVLVTNNGSLYTLTDNKELLVFASEKYMLQKVLNNSILSGNSQSFRIKQLNSLTGLHINLDDFHFTPFRLDNKDAHSIRTQTHTPYEIEEISLKSERKLRTVVLEMNSIAVNPKSSSEKKLLEFNLERISKLKKCTKCLLPETFPFIEFDEKGVCNICRNYVKKNNPKPVDELYAMVEPYRDRSGQPDCIVPFSGGRDSTYTLHIVKNILKLNPIAFTYDWGMVTDLARRNIARVCGKLGVENIIVSADIRLKRENIRKNISAWLKKPSLGLVPLFMAGDKYFFYYSNLILKQNKLHLSIFGSNPFENTEFKLGFAGIKPNFSKKRIDALSIRNKVKLLSFFGYSYLTNLSYLNSSLTDTFGSFLSRYAMKRYGYVQLFDYIQWNEKEIEVLLTNEFNWEKAIDTNSTWRIGDGTAALYNYIYYTVAGFSENDTFRSNQIRAGLLNRDIGLNLINRDNYPRYETIKWYLEIIGLDFENTVNRINSIPKLYNQYA